MEKEGYGKFEKWLKYNNSANHEVEVKEHWKESTNNNNQTVYHKEAWVAVHNPGTQNITEIEF